jgi:hypothetical protein
LATTKSEDTARELGAQRDTAADAVQREVMARGVERQRVDVGRHHLPGSEPSGCDGQDPRPGPDVEHATRSTPLVEPLESL